jgi:hypothetical protein
MRLLKILFSTTHSSISSYFYDLTQYHMFLKYLNIFFEIFGIKIMQLVIYKFSIFVNIPLKLLRRH